MPPDIAIDVANLSFAHRKDVEQSLVSLSLKLPAGSRTILIGANGAGKSTLLQILAGKRLMPDESKVLIKGSDVFRKPHPDVTFLGTEWAMNPVVRGDIQVAHFLDSVGGYRYKERRDRLLDILDVDLDWHMHEISDGERRRVQLVMGLMPQWDVLLLDEVTVDLDVLVRDELLSFLMEESETRGATVLYATHIFDGLNHFPTHVAHMRLGEFVQPPQRWAPPLPGHGRSGPHLHEIALEWLKQDREFRRGLERKGRKVRGARKDDVPTDSETFYRKYDYHH